MRLLIVHDDSRARRALAKILVELGHTPVVAASPEEGRDQIEAEPFDLVFVGVPSVRGKEMTLARTVRRRWPSVPLVALSERPEVAAAVQRLGSGVIDLSRKPLDTERVSSILTYVEEGLVLPGAPGAPTEVVDPPASPTSPRSSSLASQALGEGRLESAVPEGRVQKVLRIDATDAPPNLLARLLVGSYITGQDQVLVTSRHGLTPAQRKEIHQLVDRILGMSVVGDSPEVVEIQNFVDPGKYELPRLLHRVVQMLRSELEACRDAITGRDVTQLARVDTIEEEIDRFYLLIVRQLLLSSDNPRIARNIDVESHHYQMGYRLVAKVLEVTGDLIHGIGTELTENLPGLRRLPGALLRELVERTERLDHLLGRTMEAFDHLSVVEANATLNVIGEALPKDLNFGQRLSRSVPNRKVSLAAQRIAYHLDMALEMLIIVNEVTINRCVEPETVARTGTQVAMGSRRPLAGAKLPLGGEPARPSSKRRRVASKS